MERREVKINEWLLEGFELYKGHISFLIMCSLVVFIFSAVTAGILAGPLLCGLILVIFRLHDNDTEGLKYGEVLRGFQFFGASVLFVLVWGCGIGLAVALLNFIPFIGQVAALAVSAAMFSLLMFGLFLIVDKGLGFSAASMESINVVKSNPWPFIGFGSMTMVIGMIGSVLCGVGVVLTLPLQFCMLAIAYREIFSGVVTDHAVTLKEREAEWEAKRMKQAKDKKENGPKTWELSEEEVEKIESE